MHFLAVHQHQIVFGVIVFTVLFALVGVLVAVLAYLDAWTETKSRPRVAMEWCTKHGAYKKEHAIPLPGTVSGMCPRCYQEALKISKGA